MVGCDLMLKEIINSFLNIEKEAETRRKRVLNYNEKYHYNNEIKKTEYLLRRLKL